MVRAVLSRGVCGKVRSKFQLEVAHRSDIFSDHVYRRGALAQRFTVPDYYQTASDGRCRR